MLDATRNKKNNTENETYVFQKAKLLESEEMKNITLRKDGRYMGRKRIAGVDYTVYAHTQKQCIANLKKAIKLKKEKSNKSYLLYEWLDNWFVTYKKRFVSIATARIISNTIKEIKNNMPNTNITTLTTQQIQNFLNLYTASRKKDFLGLYLNACLQKAEDINLITKKSI